MIPFSYSQDTAGPIARTVSDAAVLLSALVGKDEHDPATWRNDHVIQDYTTFLDKNALQGARIGGFSEVPEYVRESGEYNKGLFHQAVSELIKAGAKVIENIEIPSFHGPWQWNKMNLEFNHGVENYLQRLPAHMPFHSLSELIDWNEKHADEALKYGQDMLKFREGLTDPLKNKDYILESTMDLYLAQNEGIDYAINCYQLDAIMFPAYIGADICAKAGYPSIVWSERQTIWRYFCRKSIFRTYLNSHSLFF